MKPLYRKILPLGLGIFATLPVFAIEPPKDDAPPPPSIKTPANTPTPTPEAETDDEEKARPRGPRSLEEKRIAFIGLVTAEVPEMLAAHIGLKAGEGVMIRDLAPGGPAEKAGFSRFDVITRVGGESVGSPEELSQRITARNPDDEVSIDYIHEGNSAVKTVKLEARPANSGRIDNPADLGHLDLDNMPDRQAGRLRDMIERRLNGLMRESEEFPELPKNNRGFDFKSDATFRLMDNEGSVEMKTSDGSKKITVRGHDNTITWSGPWDTEEDKAAAPPAVRERIERFKFDEGFRGGGFRFRMGPRGPGDDE